MEKNDKFLKELKSQYRHTSSFFSGTALALVDAIVFMASICLGFFIINFINPSWINFKSFVKYTVFMPGVFAIFYATGLYPGILLAPEEEIKRFSITSFFILMGEAVAIMTIKSTYDFIPIAAALVLAWPFCTLFLPLGREVAKRFYSRFSWWGVPAIVYSKKDEAKEIVDRLTKRKFLGYIPIIIITDSQEHLSNFDGIPVLTQGAETDEILKALKIKVAIICGYENDIEKILTNFRYVIRVPKDRNIAALSLRMKDFGGILGFSSTNYLTKPGALFIKRSLDIAACLLASPILILATIIISIIIKITSPGPVFFGHKRVGRYHKEIKCWKFRSMVNNSQEMLEHILATDPVRAAEWEKDRKFTDDPRVTKFGKFLRKTSLDELPQLWNVFTGEMSLIGPRPVTEPELEKYGKYTDYVLSVKPGLSGMWQISGRSDTGYEERINLDTYYIQNWSVWIDLWILIKTIAVVIKGKGAY